MKTIKRTKTPKVNKTLKISKTIKRIRFVDGINETEVLEPKSKIVREKTTADIEADKYKLACVLRYIDMYRERFAEAPFPYFVEQQVIRNKSSKHSKLFRGIALFLCLERERHNACNNMEQLINDYFSCVFDYYKRFNRRPTINQISAGPTNASQFIEFVNNEEDNRGGYWVDKDREEEVKRLVEYGGEKYRDDFLDAIRINLGLKPLFESGN